MALTKGSSEVPRTRKKSAAHFLRVPESIQVAIVFVPVLVTLLYVHFFSVDLPFMDQWEVVPAVMHMESGHLHWSDIYRQHNEAIVPVSIALTLVVAKLTRYNVVAEAYIAYACLVGALLVLFVFFRRVQRKLPIMTLAFLPISAMFLGWRGHEGILWGAGLNSNLGLLLMLLAIWGAIRAAETARWIWGAIILAILAAFSFGSGLLAWPLGLAILLFPAEGQRSGRLILIWIAAAVMTTAVYFDGYMIHRVPWPTGIGYVLGHLFPAAYYTLVYTGSALGGTRSADARINLALTLLFLPAGWVVLRSKELRKAVLPFSAVLAFLWLTVPPVLSGRLGLAGAGGLSMQVDQPYLASRYASISALWTTGIYIYLLALAFKRKIWRYVAAAALVLLCVGIAGGYQEGLTYARIDRVKKTACREILKNYLVHDDADLSCYYPDVIQGRRWAFWLDEFHLSVFREGSTAARW